MTDRIADIWGERIPFARDDQVVTSRSTPRKTSNGSQLNSTTDPAND